MTDALTLTYLPNGINKFFATEIETLHGIANSSGTGEIHLGNSFQTYLYFFCHWHYYETHKNFAERRSLWIDAAQEFHVKVSKIQGIHLKSQGPSKVIFKIILNKNQLFNMRWALRRYERE